MGPETGIGTKPARDTSVEIIILSRGMQHRLQICPETEQLLRQRGIDYRITETKEAVELFNDLSRDGKKVGGIFHSTC